MERRPLQGGIGELEGESNKTATSANRRNRWDHPRTREAPRPERLNLELLDFRQLHVNGARLAELLHLVQDVGVHTLLGIV